MATITLDRDECGEGYLPPVCVKCGEPASEVRRTPFQWFPPVVTLFIFCCIPLYILLIFLWRKQMTVYLPVCDRHKGIWFRRKLAFGVGIGCLVAGVWIGATFGREVDLYLGIQSTTPIAVCTGLAAGVGLIAIAGIGAVQPKRIRENDITLKGVSSVFVDTVEQYRLLLEDDE